MPGATPEEALDAFVTPLQNVLNCLASGHNFKIRHLDDDSILVATPADGVALTRDVGLQAVLIVKPVIKNGQHAVSTRSYKYTIYQNTLSRPTRYMWHWHPESRRSPVTYPHFHTPPGIYLSKRHFPTGRVAFEDIALFALDELGLSTDNPDAREKIASHRALHAENRSWH